MAPSACLGAECQPFQPDNSVRGRGVCQQNEQDHLSRGGGCQLSQPDDHASGGICQQVGLAPGAPGARNSAQQRDIQDVHRVLLQDRLDSPGVCELEGQVRLGSGVCVESVSSAGMCMASVWLGHGQEDGRDQQWVSTDSIRMHGLGLHRDSVQHNRVRSPAAPPCVQTAPPAGSPMLAASTVADGRARSPAAGSPMLADRTSADGRACSLTAGRAADGGGPCESGPSAIAVGCGPPESAPLGLDVGVRSAVAALVPSGFKVDGPSGGPAALPPFRSGDGQPCGAAASPQGYPRQHKAAVGVGDRRASETAAMMPTMTGDGQTCGVPEVAHAGGADGSRMCVSLSGFSSQQRLRIAGMCAWMGVALTGSLTRGNTHLICQRFEGRKFETASMWGHVHIVSEAWLLECERRRQGGDPARVPEGEYGPGGRLAGLTSSAERGAGVAGTVAGVEAVRTGWPGTGADSSARTLEGSDAITGVGSREGKVTGSGAIPLPACLAGGAQTAGVAADFHNVACAGLTTFSSSAASTGDGSRPRAGDSARGVAGLGSQPGDVDEDSVECMACEPPATATGSMPPATACVAAVQTAAVNPLDGRALRVAGQNAAVELGGKAPAAQGATEYLAAAEFPTQVDATAEVATQVDATKGQGVPEAWRIRDEPDASIGDAVQGGTLQQTAHQMVQRRLKRLRRLKQAAATAIASDAATMVPSDTATITSPGIIGVGGDGGRACDGYGGSAQGAGAAANGDADEDGAVASQGSRQHDEDAGGSMVPRRMLRRRGVDRAAPWSPCCLEDMDGEPGGLHTCIPPRIPDSKGMGTDYGFAVANDAGRAVVHEGGLLVDDGDDNDNDKHVAVDACPRDRKRKRSQEGGFVFLPIRRRALDHPERDRTALTRQTGAAVAIETATPATHHQADDFPTTLSGRPIGDDAMAAATSRLAPQSAGLKAIRHGLGEAAFAAGNSSHALVMPERGGSSVRATSASCGDPDAAMDKGPSASIPVEEDCGPSAGDGDPISPPLPSGSDASGSTTDSAAEAGCGIRDLSLGTWVAEPGCGPGASGTRRHLQSGDHADLDVCGLIAAKPTEGGARQLSNAGGAAPCVSQHLGANGAGGPDNRDDAKSAGGSDDSSASKGGGGGGREAEESLCIVCFEEMSPSGTVTGVLECQHTFCFSCILEWSEVASVCPLCKAPFHYIMKVPPRLSTQGAGGAKSSGPSPAGPPSLPELVLVEKRRQRVPYEDEGVDAMLLDEEEDEEDPVNCYICSGCDAASLLLLCDGPGCPRAAHTFCLNPPLQEVPEGDWFCHRCSAPEVPRTRLPRRTRRGRFVRTWLQDLPPLATLLQPGGRARREGAAGRDDPPGRHVVEEESNSVPSWGGRLSRLRRYRDPDARGGRDEEEDVPRNARGEGEGRTQETEGQLWGGRSDGGDDEEASVGVDGHDAIVYGRQRGAASHSAQLEHRSDRSRPVVPGIDPSFAQSFLRMASGDAREATKCAALGAVSANGQLAGALAGGRGALCPSLESRRAGNAGAVGHGTGGSSLASLRGTSLSRNYATVAHGQAAAHPGTGFPTTAMGFGAGGAGKPGLHSLDSYGQAGSQLRALLSHSTAFTSVGSEACMGLEATAQVDAVCTSISTKAAHDRETCHGGAACSAAEVSMGAGHAAGVQVLSPIARNNPFSRFARVS
eukprot:jgi/Mesvir1/5454/Mv15510-RA.1